MGAQADFLLEEGGRGRLEGLDSLFLLVAELLFDGEIHIRRFLNGLGLGLELKPSLAVGSVA